MVQPHGKRLAGVGQRSFEFGKVHVGLGARRRTVVEMAGNPVHIPEPLYLYEPSGVGKATGRAAREEVIRRIVAKEPGESGRTVRQDPATVSGLHEAATQRQ